MGEGAEGVTADGVLQAASMMNDKATAEGSTLEALKAAFEAFDKEKRGYISSRRRRSET